MAAYLIVETKVKDRAAFQEYITKTPATIIAHGGNIIASAGSRSEPLEGDWEKLNTLIIWFPSMEAAKTWYRSEEYQPLKALRKRVAENRLMLLEGR